MSTAKPEISIVAPAYNEEANIEQSVRSWIDVVQKNSLHGEIVVTDDGSRDRTRDILKSLQSECSYLKIVEFDLNRGYGKALAAAMEAASGRFVVTIDSDGQFNPADILLLMARQREGDFDLVTGFRRRKNDSLLRVLADRGLNLLVRMVFRVRLRDTNCALKIIRRDRLADFRIESSGYPTPTEITLKSNLLGFKLAEVGIDHLERTGGQSSLKVFSTAWKMLKILIYFRLKFSLYQQGIIRSL